MNNKWNKDLTPEQNYILREEGTEPPGSSPLNQEKREGDYLCAGCGVKLFDSTMKFDIGSYKVDLGPITISRVASILLIIGFLSLIIYNTTL